MAKKKAEAAPAPQDTPVQKQEQTPEERAEAMKKAREANETRNNDRVARLNAIADANDEIRRPDMEETDGTVTFRDETDEREATEVREQEEAERNLAEAQARELQEEGAAPDEETAQDEKVINGVRHYLTIVNGKEKWLTLKQLREISQKVDSADEYLAAAAESVRSAAGQALSKADEPVRLKDKELRETLRAAVLGDEEAIEKLASALEARPSEVTPDVLQQIDQRLSFRTELTQLESEQREILEHPMLGRLFRTRVNELKSEAPTTPLAKAYRSIGKEIREAFPEKFKKSGVTLADKEARKRTLPAPVQAAGRQMATEEEEAEETVESVIEQMAKARGQRAIVHKGVTRN